MPSALITGAGGFIGAVLARRLLTQGWTAHLLARVGTAIADDLSTACRVHRLEGATAGLVETVGAVQPDVVFHLASLYLAEHRPDDLAGLVASNILLTAQLAEAMTLTLPTGAARLVSTGTAWQHFRGPDYVPVNLYAATKQAGDDLLRYFTDARGLSLIRLKLFDTYGAGDTRRKLVQLLVDAATSGERLGMSPGEQVIDISHVDDVVEAFLVAGERLLAAPASLDEAYLLSGERFRVRDLVPLVEQATGRSLDVAFGERPYRAREVMEPVVAVTGDRLPGWASRHRLADTVATLAG